MPRGGFWSSDTEEDNMVLSHIYLKILGCNLKIIIPHNIRATLVTVGTIIVFLPMLLNHTEGADFPRYFDWATAFNQRNIFCLEETTLSPTGVPLSQMSFGPGLIFSLGSLFSKIEPVDAVFIGWLFAVMFWVSYIGILLHASKNNYSIALFGACITFIGTPIGYYSFEYASESLSYTCLSILIYWVISRNRFSLYDYLAVGIWAALLVTVRSQLAIYLLPLFALFLFKIRDEIKSGGSSVNKVLLGAGLCIPLLLALLAALTVNYWMTGSAFESVYNFGYADFKSIDFLHPELLAVLVHPLHGLLVYHPLYLIVFAVLAFMICMEQNRPRQLLLSVVAIVVMLHILLHASWYVWWLGGTTFGMRGLSICAILLIPALIQFMAEREALGKSNNMLFVLIVLSCLWSFVLLTQGPSQYYTYQHLFSGISSAMYNLIELNFFVLPAAVFGLGTVITLIFGKHNSLLSLKNIVTTLLLTFVVHYQITILFYSKAGMLLISVFSLFALSVILTGYHIVLEEFQRYAYLLQRAFLALSVFGFVVMTVTFVNLAVTTDRVIADKIPAPTAFTHIGKVDIDEVRESYKEYLQVPGFDDKKTLLNNYLNYLEKRDENSSRQFQKTLTLVVNSGFFRTKTNRFQIGRHTSVEIVRGKE